MEVVQEPKQRAQAETWEIPSECQKKAFSFGGGGRGEAVAGCQGLQSLCAGGCGAQGGSGVPAGLGLELAGPVCGAVLCCFLCAVG